VWQIFKNSTRKISQHYSNTLGFGFLSKNESAPVGTLNTLHPDMWGTVQEQSLANRKAGGK